MLMMPCYVKCIVVPSDSCNHKIHCCIDIHLHKNEERLVVKIWGNLCFRQIQNQWLNVKSMTIWDLRPSRKQWDQRSPVWHSWLSASTDKCWSAHECGHNGLIDTSCLSDTGEVRRKVGAIFEPSTVAQLPKCRTSHCYWFATSEHSSYKWRGLPKRHVKYCIYS